MDLQLLAALIIGVALIVALILGTCLDAFLALLLGALATGLIAGVAPVETVDMTTAGFGSTLASIGIVIGLGVMIGLDWWRLPLYRPQTEEERDFTVGPPLGPGPRPRRWLPMRRHLAEGVD